MDALAPILTIAAVHLAAVMSPGVAFLIITRNTLRYSWRVGALTALGVGLTSMGYIALGLIGVAAIIAAQSISTWRAMRGGMLAQLANVTAILYILSVFTSLIAPDTPGGVRIAMAGVMALISVGWYVLLARLVANPAFRRGYARFERAINIVFGLILIGLAIRIVVR